jgi:hypothetical protein
MVHARQFLLSQSTDDEPLYAAAPCPHDGACPLAGMRDPCAFSQRLQTPNFLRRTKHHKKGEEDKGYTYLVIARGERPISEGMLGTGLVGGVGKAAVRREMARNEGRSILQEIVGSESGATEFEPIPIAQSDAGGHEARSEDGQLSGSPYFAEVDVEGLRLESYEWPRIVAPPLKKAGHVILDVCHSDGEISPC